MTKRRRTTRPSTPEEIARRRAEALAREREPQNWGANAEALALPANAAVAVETDLRGKVARARRRDVFELFRVRGALSQDGHDAVRRLQDDIAVLHRTLASGLDLSPKVDRSRLPDTFSERRRRAGERIEAVLTLTGPASARLITALCEPDVIHGRPPDWREVVERETGERLPDAQGALVRAACENLAGAYAVLARNRRPDA
jgi:hypothetical protein